MDTFFWPAPEIPSTTPTLSAVATHPTNKKDLPTNFSDTVQLDSDNQLPDSLRNQFRQVLQKFDSV